MPTLRVMRNDHPAVEFQNGVAIVYTPEDISLLRGIESVEEVGATAKTAQTITADMLKPPNLEHGFVSWFSPLLGTADGYGSSAEQMILALEAKGVRVALEPGYKLSSKETHIEKVMQRSRKRSPVFIPYCPPSISVWTQRFPGQAVLGFTMWEDNVVPSCWLPALQKIDALATCSKFNVKLFEEFLAKHGIDVPVVYVPLGVNHELYPYQKREFKRGNATFKVLHTSTYTGDKRKGADLAYKAFAEAFVGQADVQLTFRAKFGEIPDVAAGDARVVVNASEITDKQKLDVLYDHHVYLCPSRGEGFGLMPLEAIASGLPAIVAANTAMLDYVDLYTPIHCGLEPSGITVPFQERSDGQWGVPDHNEMVTALRSHYENYSGAVNRSARAAKLVRKRWGYERSADALLSAMEIARVSYERKLPTRELCATGGA